MSTEKRFKELYEKNSDRIQESIIINDSVKARALLHDDKRTIITSLINNKARTIQNLNADTGINPGTIKRHIDDLISKKLVIMLFEDRSLYNVKMKFYSAIANEFKIDIEIPEKTEEEK